MIVLRQVKGSELTWDEVDNNFIELQTTASNGLTKTGSNVTLGGDYTTPIIIGNLIDYSHPNIVLTPDSLWACYGNPTTPNFTGYATETSVGVKTVYLSNKSASNDLSIRITPTELLVFDETLQKGLTENGDYSANKTAYSYVTKQMLDAATGTSYTFSNGLTNTADIVTLGGSYTGSVVIGDDSDYTVATFAMYNNGNVDLYTKFNGSNSSSLNLKVNSGFSLQSDIGDHSFRITNQIISGIPRLTIVNDFNGSADKGIYYDKDYSVNWTSPADDNILVTKKYVDDNSSGSSSTLESVLLAGNHANNSIILADFYTDATDFQGIKLSSTSGYSDIENHYSGSVSNKIRLHPGNGSEFRYTGVSGDGSIFICPNIDASAVVVEHRNNAGGFLDTRVGDLTASNFYLYDNIADDYLLNTTSVGTAFHASIGLLFKKKATDGISSDFDVNITVNPAQTGGNINLTLPNASGTLALASKTAAAPTPTSSGQVGEVITTGGYRYECIAVDTWTRVAVETTWS